MKPRAVVTLGTPARKEFGLEYARITPAARAGVEFSAVALSHPVARRLNWKKDHERWIDYEARILRRIITAG
jgi:hypothetical protein